MEGEHWPELLHRPSCLATQGVRCLHARGVGAVHLPYGVGASSWERCHAAGWGGPRFPTPLGQGSGPKASTAPPLGRGPWLLKHQDLGFSPKSLVAEGRCGSPCLLLSLSLALCAPSQGLAAAHQPGTSVGPARTAFPFLCSRQQSDESELRLL